VITALSYTKLQIHCARNLTRQIQPLPIFRQCTGNRRKRLTKCKRQERKSVGRDTKPGTAVRKSSRRTTGTTSYPDSHRRKERRNADNTLAELRKELSASDDRLTSKQDELAALLAEKNRIENEFKDMASLASNQAQTIKTAMSEAGHDNVEVEVGDDNTIGILLGSGQLFRTGSSLLSSDGQRVLTELAKSFESIENRRIMISGHSDDVPLGAKLQEVFKDNWGLSLARALATAEFFTDNAGITADRMSVTGFGATQPVASTAPLLQKHPKPQHCHHFSTQHCDSRQQKHSLH